MTDETLPDRFTGPNAPTLALLADVEVQAQRMRLGWDDWSDEIRTEASNELYCRMGDLERQLDPPAAVGSVEGTFTETFTEAFGESELEPEPSLPLRYFIGYTAHDGRGRQIIGSFEGFSDKPIRDLAALEALGAIIAKRRRLTGVVVTFWRRFE